MKIHSFFLILLPELISFIFLNYHKYGAFNYSFINFNPFFSKIIIYYFYIRFLFIFIVCFFLYLLYFYIVMPLINLCSLFLIIDRNILKSLFYLLLRFNLDYQSFIMKTYRWSFNYIIFFVIIIMMDQLIMDILLNLFDPIN
jgi:hypothetical protein